MDIESLYRIYQKFPRVTTDTRKDLNGSLFFCLKGANFDANAFALQALEKGAAHVVADDPSLSSDTRITIVNDGLSSLQSLASHHRKQLKAKVIGLTGSNGKTTNKELIAAVLSTTFITQATQGNLNNHIGVPLTLLGIKPATEIAVIEMGANHQCEIRELSAICLPEYGMITNIGLAHLEGFGGPEGVRKGKKELFDHIRTHGGKVFVNGADPVLIEISEGLDRVVFGGSRDGIRGEVHQQGAYLLFSYHEGKYESPTIRTQLTGAYNLSNLLAAVCMGRYFGVSHENILRALEAYTPTNQRSQVVKTERNTVILDAYNANPSSLEAAIDNLGMLEGKKLALIGHMMELGDASANAHQKVINQLRAHGIDAVLVGNGFKSCANNPFQLFDTSEALRAWLLANPSAGSTILVKGSRLAAMERVLDAL